MDFQTLYDLLVSDIDYEPIVTFLKSYLDKSKTVLDAGCGSGVILVPLVQSGYQITGIDIDEKSLGITQRKLIELKLNAQLFAHDLKEPLGHQFDQIIMMNDVINYFKGCKQIFKYLKQALSKQGKLIFDCYKYEYLELMDGYVEKESSPIDYTWRIKVRNETLYHQIEADKTYQIKQYVKKSSYYLDILNNLGFHTEVVDGPDDRKHYIIASL